MCDHALASASMQDYGTPFGGRLDGDVVAAREEVEAYHRRSFTWTEFFERWPLYKKMARTLHKR